MGEIHHIEVHTMALFYSTDGAPGFGVRLCRIETLWDAVKAATWFGELTDDARTEIDGHVDQLKQTGRVDFEDGWLQLQIGIASVIEFLLDRVLDAKREEQYADAERFKELKAREEWRTRYEALRSALADALGPHAPEIVAKVA